MKKISVCINLDSLTLGSGWKLPIAADPTYRLVDEKLISRLSETGAKAILFAVGKDLKSVENGKILRKWSRQGHEIGNHTFSHPLNLASLKRDEIETEIERADKLIKQITGKKPVSFNAPGWAVSKEIDGALVRSGYKIDYSPFLSWWMYPLLLKQWWSLRGERIAKTVWWRRDLFYLFRPLPSSVLTKNPLPVVTWLKIPVWHTGWFIFGDKIFPRLIKSAIKENPGFYYLMHPADVIGREDIPAGFRSKINFERMNTPISDKIKYLDLALKILHEKN